jgi:hypothetical protein
MPSRGGKILGALTNTGAKRFGLSCTAISATVALVASIHAEDPYRISRLAEQSLLVERAEKMGMDAYQVERQIKDQCWKKSANLDFASDCYNAELFGGFGEILDRRRQLMRAEYYGLSLLAIVLVGLIAGAAGWLLIAFVVPLCLNYWAWLRRR